MTPAHVRRRAVRARLAVAPPVTRRLRPLALAACLAAGACRHAAPMPALRDTLPATVGRQSWTGDTRAFAVGEVLLVDVDEFTLASTSSGDAAARSRWSEASLGIAAALKGRTLADADAGLRTGSDVGARRSGDARRQNRFTSQIAVRVAGYGPGGVLYVRGRKLVAIDRSSQEVELSGWVRPQDVHARNVVLSSRIADARLAYVSRGSLDQPSRGLVARLLGWLF